MQQKKYVNVFFFMFLFRWLFRFVFLFFGILKRKRNEMDYYLIYICLLLLFILLRNVRISLRVVSFSEYRKMEAKLNEKPSNFFSKMFKVKTKYTFWKWRSKKKNNVRKNICNKIKRNSMHLCFQCTRKRTKKKTIQ